MYGRCLKCDYALVCMSVERTDVIRCVRCRIVDVIVAVVTQKSGAVIATKKLCDIGENTTYECADRPYRSYVESGGGALLVLCDLCTEMMHSEQRQHTKAFAMRAFNAAANVSRTFTFNLKK